MNHWFQGKQQRFSEANAWDFKHSIGTFQQSPAGHLLNIVWKMDKTKIFTSILHTGRVKEKETIWSLTHYFIYSACTCSVLNFYKHWVYEGERESYKMKERDDFCLHKYPGKISKILGSWSFWLLKDHGIVIAPYVYMTYISYEWMKLRDPVSMKTHSLHIQTSIKFLSFMSPMMINLWVEREKMCHSVLLLTSCATPIIIHSYPYFRKALTTGRIESWVNISQSSSSADYCDFFHLRND